MQTTSTETLSKMNSTTNSTGASSAAGGWEGWKKAVEVTNLASDPEQVYVRLEKLLTGEQGTGGVQLGKKAHLFPMLSRAMPISEVDARGLHLRGNVICDKRDLTRTLEKLEKYSTAA